MKNKRSVYLWGLGISGALVTLYFILFSFQAVELRFETELGNFTISLSKSNPKLRNQLSEILEGKCGDSLSIARIKRDQFVELGAVGKGLEDCRIYGNDTRKEPLLRGNVALYNQPNNGILFVIIQGQSVTEADLDRLEKTQNITFTSESRALYKQHGGIPQFQGKLTVIGTVESGLETIERIGYVAKDADDKPIRRLAVKVH